MDFLLALTCYHENQKKKNRRTEEEVIIYVFNFLQRLYSYIQNIAESKQHHTRYFYFLFSQTSNDTTTELRVWTKRTETTHTT